MKIAFISLMGGLPWGGSEALWSKTAFLALKEGHEVLASVYDWGKETPHTISELKENGAQIHLRQKWSGSEGIISKLRRILAKTNSNLSENWKALVDFKPDSVFISQGDNFDLALHHKELYFILRNNRINYSFVCHNHVQYSEIPESNIYPFAKEVFNNAKHVLFVSQRQWRLTERKLCQKIYNGRLTWNPLNLEKPEYLPWPKNEIPQLAIVANIISGKGHDTLFEVLSSEKWKTREWQLNIYGKGYGEGYLKDLAAFYQIEDRIIFHGHVASATQIWEKNHILLIPSSGEGLPISLVEAAICGRPAVVTDVGGNTEIVIENETGFVAFAPSVDSFSEAMERAWVLRENWKIFGREFSSKLLSHFDNKPELLLLKII